MKFIENKEKAFAKDRELLLIFNEGAVTIPLHLALIILVIGKNTPHLTSSTGLSQEPSTLNFVKTTEDMRQCFR